MQVSEWSFEWAIRVAAAVRELPDRAREIPDAPGDPPHSQLYLRTFFIVVLVPPPPGVRGRVRTAIFQRKPGVSGRFRPGSGWRFCFNFHVDLKYSWALNPEVTSSTAGHCILKLTDGPSDMDMFERGALGYNSKKGKH